MMPYNCWVKRIFLKPIFYYCCWYWCWLIHNGAVCYRPNSTSYSLYKVMRVSLSAFVVFFRLCFKSEGMAEDALFATHKQERHSNWTFAGYGLAIWLCTFYWMTDFPQFPNKKFVHEAHAVKLKSFVNWFKIYCEFGEKRIFSASIQIQ